MVCAEISLVNSPATENSHAAAKRNGKKRTASRAALPHQDQIRTRNRNAAHNGPDSAPHCTSRKIFRMVSPGRERELQKRIYINLLWKQEHCRRMRPRGREIQPPRVSPCGSSMSSETPLPQPWTPRSSEKGRNATRALKEERRSDHDFCGLSTRGRKVGGGGGAHATPACSAAWARRCKCAHGDARQGRSLFLSTSRSSYPAPLPLPSPQVLCCKGYHQKHRRGPSPRKQRHALFFWVTYWHGDCATPAYRPHCNCAARANSWQPLHHHLSKLRKNDRIFGGSTKEEMSGHNQEAR